MASAIILGWSLGGRHPDHKEAISHVATGARGFGLTSRNEALESTVMATPRHEAGTIDSDPAHPITLPIEQVQERIHELLTSDTLSDKAAGHNLFTMLNSAISVASQLEISSHAINLLGNDLAAKAVEIVNDERFDSAVQEVWFSALLNEPLEKLLPSLVEIAQQKTNPYSEVAIEVLSFHTDFDLDNGLPNDLTEQVANFLNDL